MTMKARYVLCVAALALGAGAAQAHGYGKRADTGYVPNTTYVPNAGSAIHSGGMSAEDTALADSVAAVSASMSSPTA